MRVFAHTRKDGILVALAVAQVAVVAAATVYSTTLPLGWTLSLGAGTVFLICTNFQCVAHNFIHNPFFVSKPLNHAFSVLNTLCIGVPQSLYRVHHLHHHKYNNDAKDPATGTTRPSLQLHLVQQRLSPGTPLEAADPLDRDTGAPCAAPARDEPPRRAHGALVQLLSPSASVLRESADSLTHDVPLTVARR